MIKPYDWVLFIMLSLIWGSSFILMKEGLQALTPYQVASIRILAAGIGLLPFTGNALRKIPPNKYLLVLLSGLLGSFFPAYLFCIAETRINSSLTGILNALTPLFALLLGVAFFQLQVSRLKIIGIIIGFAGLLLLPFASMHNVELADIKSMSLVLLATIFYGINVNLVGKHLQGATPIHIASLAFGMLIIPCICILIYTGFLKNNFTSPALLISIGYSTLLGLMGTAVASVLFYKLVKSAGTIFASLVTYGIPIIAIIWGLAYGESFRWQQIICLLIILFGVYLVNKKPLIKV